MMRTLVDKARPRQSSAAPGEVLVLCRLLLISQAIGAALGDRGIRAEVMPWTEGLQRATDGVGESDVVLLFDDLEDRDSIAATMGLVRTSPARFVVLTPRPEGAAWGALLASGAIAVLPTESTLVVVGEVVTLVRQGGSPIDDAKRDLLVGEWLSWVSEDDALRTRLAHLSRRERQVLDLLAAGHRVSEIVHDLGVADTTVRSHIKSIRRKLEVGSQLAAVAALHRLGAGPMAAIDGPGPLLPSPRRSGEQQPIVFAP